MDDAALFDLAENRKRQASRRHGLETDIRRARDAGSVPAAAMVASLRRLAAELDAFHPRTGYDRVALANLQRQFDDTYFRTFGMGPSPRDPIEELLADIRQAETVDPT